MTAVVHIARQVRWPRALGLVLALSVSLTFWSAVAMALRTLAR